MASVNHKKIRDAIEDKKSKISDKDFFTVRKYGYARFLEDIASAQTKRFSYDRRPKVEIIFEPENELVAVTNDVLIRINAASSVISSAVSRQEKHWKILGLFVHELGHMLFTDFLSIQSWEKFRRDGLWFPEQPSLLTLSDVENERFITQFAAKGKKHLKYLTYIAHYIWNILEDGYIENRLSVQFPGMFGAALKSIRKEMYDMSESMGAILDKGEETTALIQGLLQYATTGSIKYGSMSLTNPIVFLLHDLLPEIDEAVCLDNPRYRAKTVNRILVHLWTYFDKEIDENEAETSDDGKKSESEEVMDIPDFLKNIIGSSTAGTGRRQIRDTVENRRKLNDLLSALLKDKKSAGANLDQSADSQEEEDGEDSSKQCSEDSNSKGNLSPGTTGKRKKADAKEEETGRLSTEGFGEAEATYGGGISYDQDYKDWFYEKAASDIERILEKDAESEVLADLESDRLLELQNFASTISYGDIHKGANIVIRRNTQVDDRLKEQYDQIKKPLLEISNLLSKKLMKELEESRKQMKMSGLIFGRRIEGRSLYRKDCKIFSKNRLPNKGGLCVAFLLDESGSMGSHDRITNVRATAIIIQDFCKKLKVPVMITGHHTDYFKRKNSVVINSYAEFEQIDQDDSFRLMGISAGGSNRDGCAIRYVCERLLKREEAVKLFIIASDGQPSDGGYFGEEAENDLRSIKQEYQRKGVIFVAAAIGDDREKIQSIYGDSFCDISDLSMLPVILTNFIKRHLRV